MTRICLSATGVDPPDVIKTSPCARLECWVDPLSMQPAKALETIGGWICLLSAWQTQAAHRGTHEVLTGHGGLYLITVPSGTSLLGAWGHKEPEIARFH